MSEKLKVRKLLDYYVDRYHMPTDGYSDITESNEDGLGAYLRALKNILKKTMVDGRSLWETMEQTVGPKRISLEDFEHYCFKEWVRYIEKNCSEYDKAALQADKAKHAAEHEWWEDASEHAIQAQNAALETGAYEYPTGDYEGAIITDEEVKQKGLEMMIEAIYDTLYDGFQWDKLRMDIELSVLPDGSEYNAEISGESLKARNRLKNYRNYVGIQKK